MISGQVVAVYSLEVVSRILALVGRHPFWTGAAAQQRALDGGADQLALCRHEHFWAKVVSDMSSSSALSGPFWRVDRGKAGVPGGGFVDIGRSGTQTWSGTETRFPDSRPFSRVQPGRGGSLLPLDRTFAVTGWRIKAASPLPSWTHLVPPTTFREGSSGRA